MSKVEDISKADRAIKDLEVRINTIKTSLDVVEREIDVLSTAEVQLEENVNYLKRKHVIALAVEYKKSKVGLTDIRNRLILLKNDRENVRRAYAESEAALHNAKKYYDKLLKGNENNVLRGNFGRKDG